MHGDTYMYMHLPQLLNAHNNCPTYKGLREMDPLTEEYQQFERENQVYTIKPLCRCT